MTNEEAKAEAARLAAQGYRRVSRRWSTVARIDREDWGEFLADRMPDAMIRKNGAWADHYRRIYSKDKKTVLQQVALLVPSSDHDPVGYVALH